MLGDADNFSVVFPKAANAEERSLIMAATIMLDYMYFEEKAGGNQNSGF